MVTRRPSRRSDWLLLITLFAATFEKLHWEVGVSVSLADLLAIAYLISFGVDCVASRNLRAPRTAVVTLAFTAAFLVCYLGGFFNIDTAQGLSQFGKGMVKLVIHLLFLTAAVMHLSDRSQRFFWTALGTFVAGMAANAIYGIVQLGSAEAGFNIDKHLLDPITRGAASSINIYGAVGNQNVYRPNALTGDPNHLGVMLVVPILILVPLYLRLEKGHRLRLPLAILAAFLFVVELATLSRSGLLGLAVGFLVLALPYRGFFARARFLVPLAGVFVVVAAVVLQRRHFFATVLRSRLQTNTGSVSAHLGVYGFIPKVLHSHPLLGLGLNNFSVYYQFVTGKTNWGPHSYYVALLVEGGITGTVIFVLFLWYLFRRLAAARAIGRALTASGELGTAARLRPLAWGMVAALLGTIAANAFYLTMQFYYFYAFAALILAVPLVFGRELAPAEARAGAIAAAQPVVGGAAAESA
jgi:O-antigen ligase